VSTGTKGYATPSGAFRPFRLEEEHYSREWDDAPMPHSIFFTAASHAIHGTNAVRRLGSPASHGCVRLAPANAAKLFDLFNRRASAARRLLLLALKQGAWQSEGPRRTMRGAPLHVQRHGWARTTMSWLGRLFGQSAGRRTLAARVEDHLSHLEDRSDVGTVPNLLRRELVIINCAESSLGKFIRKPDHPV
jgi:hypothetical protein